MIMRRFKPDPGQEYAQQYMEYQQAEKTIWDTHDWKVTEHSSELFGIPCRWKCQKCHMETTSDWRCRRSCYEQLMEEALE
jgi:hypothetical protein